MPEINPIMSVVTIDIYRVNFIIKRLRLSEFIGKKKKSTCKLVTNRKVSPGDLMHSRVIVDNNIIL